MSGGPHTKTIEEPILNDFGAERTVLAAIVHHGAEFFIEIEDVLDTPHFYGPHHQKLFSVLKHLVHEKGANSFDTPILISTAKALGHEDLIGRGRDDEYFKSLAQEQPGTDTALKLAAVIYKLYLARQAFLCATSVREDMRTITGHEPIAAILARVEDPVFAFTGKVTSNHSSLVAIGNGYTEMMKSLAAQPKDLIGLPTGFQAYDFAIGGGLRGGTVNVVGARPKNGKSFFCLSVAHNLAAYGVPALYLDTELPHRVQMTRLASLVTGVELSQIETGKFAGNPDEAKAIYSAQDYIGKLPLTHCSIAGQSIKPVLSIIRRWLTKFVGFNETGKAKPCCVVYDYIKLMDSHDIKGNLAEFQLLGFLLTEMNNFALKYDIPIFATAQLNRAGGDQEDGTVLSQSDRILWLCSSFTILKRKSPEEKNVDPPSNGDRKLVVTDTRYGAGMEPGDYINLKFDLSRASIVEGPKFSSVAASVAPGTKNKQKKPT